MQKGKRMKTYELTKKNWDKYVGDRAIVFEKDGDNLKIIGSAQAQRGYNKTITLIPNIYINEKTYSPTLINPDAMREDFGWKTFSIL